MTKHVVSRSRLTFDMSQDQKRRFWSKVERSTAGTGCWIWQAYRTVSGYGRLFLNGKVEAAHRVAYFLERGALEPNLVVDHLCRNRACVNPHHMELVTPEVNSSRGDHQKPHRRISDEQRREPRRRYYLQEVKGNPKRLAEKRRKDRIAAKAYREKQAADPVAMEAKRAYHRAYYHRRKAQSQETSIV